MKVSDGFQPILLIVCHLCKHPKDTSIKITRTLFPLFNGAGCTDDCLLFILIIHNGENINPFLLEDGVKKALSVLPLCQTPVE